MPQILTIPHADRLWSVVVRCNDGRSETYADLTEAEACEIYCELMCRYSHIPEYNVTRYHLPF